jgi:hypothetical protein
MSFFISFDQCRFEVYFVRDKYCYSCLFLGAIGLVNLNRIFSKKEIQIAKKHMKMLTISSHKGNANQNHTMIPPHPC